MLALCIFRRACRQLTRLDAELLRVFVVEPLPAGELHGVGADKATGGRTGEKMAEYVKATVPAGSAHGNEISVDSCRERETRAAGDGLEFPAHRVGTPHIFEEVWSVGAHDSCFGDERLR